MTIQTSLATERKKAPEFARILSHLRREKKMKLTELAHQTGILLPNLSAIQGGKRRPTDRQTALLAEALGLSEGSHEYARFFDAARRYDELPADVKHMSNRKPVADLLRALRDAEVDDETIRDLTEDIGKYVRKARANQGTAEESVKKED